MGGVFFFRFVVVVVNLIVIEVECRLRGFASVDDVGLFERQRSLSLCGSSVPFVLLEEVFLVKEVFLFAVFHVAKSSGALSVA